MPANNLSDPKQVKKQSQKAKRDREDELADLKMLLDTPHGRRHIWRALEFAGIFKAEILQSGSMLYAAQGQKQYGIKLMDDIMEADDEKFILMMREAKKRKESNG